MGRHTFDQGAGFWSKVAIVGECWEWTGSRTTKRYGRFKIDGRSYLVHRVALEMIEERPLGPGEQSCHTCDNPPCVRPKHLFRGTQKDNIADAMGKGRMAVQKPGAKFRRVWGVDHPRAKLTEGAIRQIRDLRAQGWSQQRIANRFGTPQTNISSILLGRTWRHVS